MARLQKTILALLSLSLLFPGSISGTNLAKEDNTASINPFYYSTRLDINQVDFSDLYEVYMTPKKSDSVKDYTQLFIDGKLSLDPTFFNTYKEYESEQFYLPTNGILGNNFSRIEIFFYPNVTKTDALTYSVNGRTKVRNNICDFSGEIKIKKVYCFTAGLGPDEYFPYYNIIAEYTLKEDPSQKGSGVLQGIFGAYGYINEDDPGVIKVDDRMDVADGYENRNYIGTWRSYNNPAIVKRCIWGDNRIPYSFDFDSGVGEIIVNSKYASPEWDRFMQHEDFEYLPQMDPDGRFIYRYKDPWW